MAIVIWWLWKEGVGDLGEGGGYLLVAIAMPGMVVGGFAWKHLKRAHAERPSDLIVGRDGFEIHGGPHDRKTFAWADVVKVSIETPPKPEKNSDKPDDSDLRVMMITFSGSRQLALASAERAGEQQSLVELAATLQAASRRDTGTPVASTAVDLLVCAGCSAALAPVDAASIVCMYCSHENAIPEKMRVLLRDAATVQRRPDAAITKLLDQPGASLVGAMFVTAAGFMMIAWPVAILLMSMEYVRDTLTVKHVLFLIGFVAACILGFYGLIRTRLVERQALRLVAVEFAAVEPAKPGEPYRCQHCLAPLPDIGADRVVVTCVYCSAGNVLGIHLGREASIAREESGSLEDALKVRKRERRRWRGVTFVALGLLVASWMSLRYGLR